MPHYRNHESNHKVGHATGTECKMVDVITVVALSDGVANAPRFIPLDHGGWLLGPGNSGA